jgi:hypothetical protein
MVINKYFVLAALIVPAPVLLAQTLPFGLKPTKAAVTPNPAATNENELANFVGNYTFAVQGVDSSLHKLALLGSITADGKGHITAGEEDFNSSQGTLTQLGVGSGSYTLNSDGTGTLTLIALNGVTESFSLSVPQIPGKVQNGALVADDSVFGASGTLNKQASPASLDGSYSFTFSGRDPENGTAAVAGTWTVANSTQAGSGTIQGSASIFVRSDGTDTVFVPLSQFTGTLSTVVDSLGRFTFQANILQGQAGTTQGGSAQFVAYALDATHFNIISVDTPSDQTPLLTGSAIR